MASFCSSTSVIQRSTQEFISMHILRQTEIQAGMHITLEEKLHPPGVGCFPFFLLGKYKMNCTRFCCILLILWLKWWYKTFEIDMHSLACSQTAMLACFSCSHRNEIIFYACVMHTQHFRWLSRPPKIVYSYALSPFNPRLALMRESRCAVRFTIS